VLEVGFYPISLPKDSASNLSSNSQAGSSNGSAQVADQREQGQRGSKKKKPPDFRMQQPVAF
jgi:hypothetical protein